MIVASLCSIPEREQSLYLTVNSILPNVDKLNVFLNNYNDIPKFLVNDKINVEISQKWGDRGDANKFFWADKIKDAYHFVCDDDIIYQRRYFRYMIDKLKLYKNKVVVSLIGSNIVKDKSNFVSYYSSRENFSINNFQKNDIKTNIVGTGVMCYHTGYISLSLDIFKINNMSDILLGVYAKKKNISLIRVGNIDYHRYIHAIHNTNNISISCTKNLENSMNTIKEQNKIILDNYPWR